MSQPPRLVPMPSHHAPGADEFGDLVRRNQSRLRSYVRAQTSGDWHLAEDIVQETLLRAWSRPRPVDNGPDSARAWLFAVARNLVFDHRRACRCRPAETSDEAVGESSFVDRRLDQVVDQLMLCGALARLSPHHRAVLRSVYWEDRSTVGTADALGIPVGTVKSRLHHAQRALRLAIAESGTSDRQGPAHRPEPAAA